MLELPDTAGSWETSEVAALALWPPQLKPAEVLAFSAWKSDLGLQTDPEWCNALSGSSCR